MVSSSSYSVGSEMPGRNDITTSTFDARFSHYRRLLYFIATRVLGGTERADEAVENCWLSASRNPPHFEYDSAFRSWLVRVLINEALAIRRSQRQQAKTGTVQPEQATTSSNRSIKMAGNLAGGTK